MAKKNFIYNLTAQIDTENRRFSDAFKVFPVTRNFFFLFQGSLISKRPFTRNFNFLFLRCDIANPASNLFAITSTRRWSYILLLGP